MKAKTFENLIRKVVREEIDYALGREIRSLKEDLRKELQPMVVEHTQRSVEVEDNITPLTGETTIKPSVKNTLREKIMGTKPVAPTRHFSQNTALNDLLNETAQGDTNLESTQSPVEGANLQGASKAVTEAVTRDYSGLMKAINKNK